MRTLVTFSMLCIAGTLLAQNYQGPSMGSIPGGGMSNTDNFPAIPPVLPEPQRVIPNHPDMHFGPSPVETGGSAKPETYNAQGYSPSSLTPDGIPPIELASFQGITQGSGFPPDPHMAAGPNHIITVVNSSFRISDKDGNTVKTIPAASWFSGVLSGAGPFDPQVMYDHFHGRWIMVWDHADFTNNLAYLLVSVSDDDNPEGVWYNWALPAHLNGSTASGNWPDFPQIGFDQDALYITSREFSFAGFYRHPKIKIVPLDQLLQNDAGPVTWNDIWAISDLNGLIHDGLRPAIVFTDPDEYYLMLSSSFTANYFVLYRLTNVLTTPVLTAVHVSVAAWSTAPNAQQPGGGVSIEAGGSAIRHAIVYRDSSIWAAHSVANGSNSSIRYVRISTVTNTAIEDARLGATGYWHFYPALMVDQNENVSITFSRSSTTEYIGAGMMFRRSTDPVGLTAGPVFKEGEAHYELVGDGRNRWGDYMGIALDPADGNRFWMLTEYAGTPANSWRTWVYSERIQPYPDQTVYPSPSSLDFGRLEVGTAAETLQVAIFNAGEPDLTVNSITNSSSAYTLINLPSFPVTLPTFDSVMVSVVFNPITGGDAIDSLSVASDDPQGPTRTVPIYGRGVIIGTAQPGVLYGTSGPTGGGLYTIDRGTGLATFVGAMGVDELKGLAIEPSSLELYGIQTDATASTLYRVSAPQGDALPVTTVDLPNMRGIVFAEDGTLYGGTVTGQLYTIDPETGDAVLIGQSPGVPYSGFSFSPVTGTLWASVAGLVGRDRIYTVNTSDGDTTLIGRTGDNADTPCLAFDATGELFGLKGISTQENTIISIDTASAVGTLIGSTGVSGLTTLVMRTDTILVSVRQPGPDGIPASYALLQNFPNPFNPTTEIRFDTPDRSHVRLTVYNLLGQRVRTLVDAALPAGSHVITWNGTNDAGNSLASGLYLYRLDATGGNSGGFTAIKKMILLR